MEKFSVEARKQHWIDFMNPETPSRNLFMINIKSEPVDQTIYYSENMDRRIEWAWKCYNQMMERTEWLNDDRVPCLNGYSLFTGTEIFAEAFGSKVFYPENNMPVARPMAHNAVEASKIKTPKWYDTKLVNLFETADILRSRAGTNAVLKLPDIQTPMDIAAMLWDKNDFYMALFEEPEAVLELAAKVEELLFPFMDAWFERYGREFITHCPDAYMPCGFSYSEDEVGIVSAEMFQKYFLPELKRISEHFGPVAMHCCATAKHQWEGFKQIPNLKLLNLNPPAVQIKEAHKFFGDHVAQWYCFGVDKNTNIPEKLKEIPEGARMVIDVAAETDKDAVRMSEALLEAMHS